MFARNRTIERCLTFKQSLIETVIETGSKIKELLVKFQVDLSFICVEIHRWHKNHLQTYASLSYCHLIANLKVQLKFHSFNLNYWNTNTSSLEKNPNREFNFHNNFDQIYYRGCFHYTCIKHNRWFSPIDCQ
jgi:hypothetical protein